MSEAFYLPLDSVINPLVNSSTTMETTNMPQHDSLTKEKLASIEVNVAEVEPETQQIEFDRLTMQSPRIYPRPVNVIRGSPHHDGPTRPFSPEIISCPPSHGGLLRPSSPTGSVRSSFSSSRRRVTRHSHWSGGFSRSHHSEVSKELTMQAESEFLALTELMSSFSRRSSSLREVWMKIISERDSFCAELDRMYERCEEYSETIERHQREQHTHTHEHEERKKEITKLRLELTAAISSSTEYKRKLEDRDCELGKARSEVSELKDVYKYLKDEHEETKNTLEETQLKLVTVEDACHHAEEDARKHNGDLESLDLKYVELQTLHTELKSKFESAHKEVTSLKHSISIYKKEKHEWLHEKGEIEERERKCHHRLGELKTGLEELQESYEKKVHELRETTETLTKVKYEREESEKKVKELRRKLHEKTCELEDAEDRCGKWKLKWVHYEREVISLREELQISKTEVTKLEKTVTETSEKLRLVIIEKKQLQKDHHGKCEEVDAHHRKILVLQETIRRTESEIKKKSEEIHSLHERIERVERDCTKTSEKCRDLETERDTLTRSVIQLKLDIDIVTEERDTVREQFHQCQMEFEEHRESYAEFHESHSGFEHEISSLRAMLREVREEREKAISIRINADRERDEATSRYEAKCREMDRLEERMHEHGHGHHGDRVRVFSGSRTISKSSVREGMSTVGEAEN